ncbi:hypothetical protein P4S56_00435 [Pseudoalteromonas sp. Hal056]|uniref:hypothetical protein n=1 Tax=Pseudoalteromonas sp. Hal056 TaxID=3035159 RepID=UPI00301C2B6B
MVSNEIRYKVRALEKGLSDLTTILQNSDSDDIKVLLERASEINSRIRRILTSEGSLIEESRTYIEHFILTIDQIRDYCQEKKLVFRSASGRQIFGVSTLKKLSNDALELLKLINLSLHGEQGAEKKEKIIIDKSESRFDELAASFKKQHAETMRESQIKIDKLLETLSSSVMESQNKVTSKFSVIEGTINEYKVEIGELGSSLRNIEKFQQKQLFDVKAAYEEAEKEIKSKKEQINEQLKIASEGVIAGSFDNGAISERRSANYLRGGSLFCMLLIVIIAFTTFMESTKYGFDWESTIFRVVLIFILSIPAAYLSRESSKHRQQEHNLHQTALDLKTIDPYIKSIPEPEQTKLRVSLVESILNKKTSNLPYEDSFPVNSHELLLEFIKKIDLSNSQAKPSNGKSE